MPPRTRRSTSSPDRSARRASGELFVPFDPVRDCGECVEGEPRLDSTRDFLRSRGITLAEGEPGDPPSATTVNGVANRKNNLALALKSQRGVEVYPGSGRFVEAARRCSLKLKTAVVSSSTNALHALRAAGLDRIFDVRVDGQTVEEEHLADKPAPDTSLEAASRLDVQPDKAAVFEGALAGVEAGRSGGFGFVVGVDRIGQADALLTHGADIVVADLDELIAS